MKIDYFLEFPYAELRSQDGKSYFKICSYANAYSDADNINDLDWHRNFMILHIPGFKAELNEVILEGRLIKFYIQELKSFSAIKKKTVIFEASEPFFELTFTLDARKKVEIAGVVQIPVGTGNKLQFSYETDLTYVDLFIKGLEDILVKFPVKEMKS
ncbi:hypothetical protein CEQ21_02150 [Niallia circulans]|uniref:Uncharacterized protein n=1 Tax=Niallia circulans TaxID=1397 RepID=A0A553SS28_NIACI|nr:hypothetical protein [Niallia circulans]TRZ39771.1 hypothetical protein CEQ21_02150 [Niallia circulans]